MREEREEIINRLDIRSLYGETIDLKPDGPGRMKALCPFHKETDPSFKIRLSDGSYKCFGCDASGSVFDFYMNIHNVEFKDAVYALKEKAGFAVRVSNDIVAEYNYFDEKGNLLFQAVRYSPKDFKQRRPDGNGGWINNLEGVRRVPYRLPEIIEAQEVIICEGEKDCDNLGKLGLTATCNPMGAGKWRQEYNEHFKGKMVTIFPDNDQEGEKHALNIARNLFGVAETVRVLRLGLEGAKDDVSDWIAANRADGEQDVIIRETLRTLIDHTPEWEPDKEPRPHIISIQKLFETSDESVSWIVDELIPDNCLALLTAPPSSFKSFLSMHLADCVTQQRPFLGREVQGRDVYYIDRENPASVQRRYLSLLGVTQESAINLWPLWGVKEPPAFPSDEYLELATEKPLLIFDSLIRFYPKGTDENSSTSIAEVMGFLRELVKRGATVLLLHHKGKSEGSEYRGSSDILGGVDIAYSIQKTEGSNVLTLKCFKSRFHIENKLPVEVSTSDDALRFEDISSRIEEARKQADQENMEILASIISDLERPNTKTIEQAAVKNGVPQNVVRRLLREGLGSRWEYQSGKGTEHIYTLLPSESSSRQELYKSDDLTSSDEDFDQEVQ